MREIMRGALGETLVSVDELFSCLVMGRHGLLEHTFSLLSFHFAGFYLLTFKSVGLTASAYLYLSSLRPYSTSSQSFNSRRWATQ